MCAGAAQKKLTYGDINLMVFIFKQLAALFVCNVFSYLYVFALDVWHWFAHCTLDVCKPHTARSFTTCTTPKPPDLNPHPQNTLYNSRLSSLFRFVRCFWICSYRFLKIVLLLYTCRVTKWPRRQALIGHTHTHTLLSQWKFIAKAPLLLPQRRNRKVNEHTIYQANTAKTACVICVYPQCTRFQYTIEWWWWLKYTCMYVCIIDKNICLYEC